MPHGKSSSISSRFRSRAAYGRSCPAEHGWPIKTTAVSGVVVDVGIVYLEGRPFIIAGMGNWLVDGPEAERALEQVALAAYQYFDRLQHSNSYGHKK